MFCTVVDASESSAPVGFATLPQGTEDTDASSAFVLTDSFAVESDCMMELYRADQEVGLLLGSICLSCKALQANRHRQMCSNKRKDKLQSISSKAVQADRWTHAQFFVVFVWVCSLG